MDISIFGIENNDLTINTSQNTSQNASQSIDSINATERLHEVHIRIRKRNGRKSITTIEGLEHFNHEKDAQFLKNIAKTLRNKFFCSASVKKNIITLQGDHREEIKTYLEKTGIISAEYIKIHGF